MGKYFGTKVEYETFDMSSIFPGNQDAKTVAFRDWLGLMGHWVETAFLQLGGGLAAPMYTKSRTSTGAISSPTKQSRRSCFELIESKKAP